MYPVIIQLIKILKLEQRLNFNNKSVYGGLEKFSVQFIKDASEQKVPKDVINSTISFLATYNGLTFQKRSKLLIEIIANLELLKSRKYSV